MKYHLLHKIVMPFGFDASSSFQILNTFKFRIINSTVQHNLSFLQKY